MISYNFYNPTKLVFGDDTIKQIGSLIKANGYKKVLLIAGGGSIKKNGNAPCNRFSNPATIG